MIIRLITAAVAMALAANCAIAQEKIRIGLVLPLSGPYADYGNQISNGARLYIARHGDTIAGRKVELIIRDDTGIAPELTKRLAQELVTNQHVDVLAGFGLSPGALAAAAVATQSGKPMVVMNAAASVLTSKSPNIVRVSHTLPQLSQPMAKWALQNQVGEVYTLVADFAPGLDAQGAFKAAYEAGGRKLLGEMKVPVGNVDFSAAVQRIKDAGPSAVFLFLPPGEATIAFMKTWVERGMDKAGVRLLGTVDLVDDSIVEAIGKPALGAITAGHYSTAHDSVLNREYVAAYGKAYGTRMRPNYMSVAGYDGMAAIYTALNKTGGDSDAVKFTGALKGASWESPRGTVKIDADTRDVVQTVYIRRTEQRNGGIYSIEFDKFTEQKAF
ncbi:ABC transporter substrate-binding protein [Noviherbaspirillum suwonense]|uniref:Branched-chain amino acid transport system substrate-binding protein n=1 Tax=Noviherbaspirillum suwonense TaxID=1224511 RepID=A0ABY1PS81_9BURK|nr:ABC transporter substrate-binding protein [Noviherbaspirillum suwonense]SMP44694.1 branched-chain amino acid transport system substrate-binding protein [Noviherbaspirillum suwonense]